MQGLRRKWFQKEEKEKEEKDLEKEEKEGLRSRTVLDWKCSLPSKRKKLFCHKTEADPCVDNCLNLDFVDCICQCKFHCQG
jgi:hypothetical protein